MTPQREQILKMFQELPPGEHLSVEDLHYCLEDQGKKVSLSTVYRTVKLMVRIGVLRENENRYFDEVKGNQFPRTNDKV